MSLLYSDALDELFGMVEAVFVDPTIMALVGTLDVRWQGVGTSAVPDRSKMWARVSTQTVTDNQVSLAANANKNLYEATGLLYVQLFCPRNLAASMENGRAVALAMRDAFRKQSPSGQIWFRNQKILELAETVDFYPINVVVQYSYKTIQ
jgi:hypothetical protein